ncbi:hypothetical protein METH_16305 [Leisingera methylohalidivorans DSM 14336]|uniref:Uncharacterized protein n=1 Tax=Leisingera methylohalidivorans DSM 14336 TaxID=999552 RepID=V9W0N1_9RHOB|nr:hypothetical protein METH_16305 [Leisingera methylohalidivorans DSM 14336]
MLAREPQMLAAEEEALLGKVVQAKDLIVPRAQARKRLE